MNKIVLILFSIIVIGCSPKVLNVQEEIVVDVDERSYEEKVDDAIENALGYFNEKMLLLTNDQTVMTLSLLNDEFNLGIEFPHPGQFTSLQKKLKDNYFRLYGKYYLDVSSPDVEEASEASFLKILDEFKADKNLRNLAFLMCKDIALPIRAYQEFQLMVEDSTDLLPEWMFHLKNMKEVSCYESTLNIDAALENTTQNVIQLIASESTKLSLERQLEAMAMLAYAKHKDDLTESRITTKVLDTQLESGGWPSNVGDEWATPYASLMAFWTLLEVNKDQIPAVQEEY